MAWRELTEDDVLRVLNAAETAAYKSKVTGEGQDVLSDIITIVVDFCRGYIADHPGNKLAAGTTLPERTHRPALHLIRKDLLTRLDMEVSEDRKTDAKEAIRYFERVAEGKVQIELPEGATDDSGPQQTIETLSTNERLATRDKLAGL
jgi:hypothetical protein